MRVIGTWGGAPESIRGVVLLGCGGRCGSCGPSISARAQGERIESLDRDECWLGGEMDRFIFATKLEG
jgi:hypothetical protein